MHPDIAASAKVAQVEEASGLLFEKPQGWDVAATTKPAAAPLFFNPPALVAAIDRGVELGKFGRETKRKS